METAQEVYNRVYKELTRHTSSFESIAIEAMKEYAVIVAKKALQDAYKNAKCEMNTLEELPYVEEDSIIEVEILTP